MFSSYLINTYGNQSRSFVYESGLFEDTSKMLLTSNEWGEYHMAWEYNGVSYSKQVEKGVHGALLVYANKKRKGDDEGYLRISGDTILEEE